MIRSRSLHSYSFYSQFFMTIYKNPAKSVHACLFAYEIFTFIPGGTQSMYVESIGHQRRRIPFICENGFQHFGKTFQEIGSHGMRYRVLKRVTAPAYQMRSLTQENWQATASSSPHLLRIFFAVILFRNHLR
ncbi:unnamed protein product [Albugo candida]|uniref:Uncharacterized protein n=1 Tax=Albugo candida TaxID=65357 RepID=A0A024GG45_9STRA|nr:unnamed protein product [Albugo candida]|eukprot:CCI45679.1 unnamed protein product [Albugo candida]